MPDRQHILRSIARVAKRLGRTPSYSQFIWHTGIPKNSIWRFFRRWNDAVRAAGLEPCREKAAPSDTELLEDWGKTVRKLGASLSRRAYSLAGRHEPRTLERRFGDWESLPREFRKFATGKREWADVVEILAAQRRRRPYRRRVARTPPPSSPQQTQHAPLKERATYGNPLDFRGLRHEPVNEQGVVLLFGMLANEMGYLIEAVQNGFPDCEAKRQIGPNRWQRVQIEFEFESRNFRDHGHPLTGCDVIVCWRHNWEECPKEMEIVELSSVIGTPGHSGD